MKHCPFCDELLEPKRLDWVTIDVCPGCAGLWFDEEELTQIARAQDGALAKVEDQFVPAPDTDTEDACGRGQCPNCGIALFEFEFKHSPGIKLDGCAQCKGIWVDDGELGAIWERTRKPARDGKSPTKSPQTASARTVAAFLVKVACPLCGEANPAEALVCWACQSVLKGRRGAMLCPQCSGRLVKAPWGELSLDKCQTCGGLWMDDQSLAALLGTAGPPVGPESLDKPGEGPGRFGLLEVPGESTDSPSQPTPHGDVKLCPVCQAPLREYEYAYSSGIQLDKCAKCGGLWVDAGELQAIKRYLWAG